MTAKNSKLFGDGFGLAIPSAAAVSGLLTLFGSGAGASPLLDKAPVFYVTNRMATIENNAVHYSSAKTDALSYGYCELGDDLRLVDPEAKPNVKVTPVQLTSRDEFYAALKDVLEKTGKRDVLVFIHGYRRSFDSTINCAAKLGAATGLPVVAFAWPSLNNPFKYFADEKNAEQSGPAVAAFLKELGEHCGYKNLSIVSHSLGARVLLWGVDNDAVAVNSEPYRSIYFVSPDMDARMYNEHSKALNHCTPNVHVLVSRGDVRLGISSIIHFSKRLWVGSKLDGLMSDKLVDFTEWDDTVFGHAIPYKLLSQLLLN